MDIALTKGNSLGNFGGGTFKGKVSKGHVTKTRFLHKISKFLSCNLYAIILLRDCKACLILNIHLKYTFQVSTNTAYYNQKWTTIRHSKAQLNRHRMTDGIQEQLNTTIEYIGFARELPMTSTKVCKSTLKKQRKS